MNRAEFLTEVERGLYGLPKEDVAGALDYFGEMIDDRTEDGMSEEEAVEAIGPVREAVESVLMELPLKKIVRARTKPSRALRIWEILLLTLGSPVWLPLLLTALALVLTVYILLWTVVAVMYCAVLAVLAVALGCTGIGVAYILSANAPGGIMLLGGGIVCAGLTILATLGCNRAAVAMAKLSRAIGRRIKSIFVKRREA